jgi:hypothetical protein
MLYIIIAESVCKLVQCNSLMFQLETTAQMCVPSHFDVLCLKSIENSFEFIIIGLKESVKNRPMHGLVAQVA